MAAGSFLDFENIKTRFFVDFEEYLRISTVFDFTARLALPLQ
jgi:hypothetical protein